MIIKSRRRPSGYGPANEETILGKPYNISRRSQLARPFIWSRHNAKDDGGFIDLPPGTKPGPIYEPKRFLTD